MVKGPCSAWAAGYHRTAYLILLCILLAGVFSGGCGSSSEDDDSDEYDLMTSTYPTFKVSDIWKAFREGEDYDGQYILVQGILTGVEGSQVTIYTVGYTFSCTFRTDVDITELQEALDDEDYDYGALIGGTCRYYQGTTNYPCLEECDYYYLY
ncbi:MAG TPA: hypothetical protein PLT09_14615 [Deltaproteobacteria bacterium]|nr:hypothetical protein [Deltaproteobacteria bacterium]HPR56613.1 hypothetical protein [Deltaproteobacteria bacterium]HXK48675.1 hypothetical protein [Deltaproteobacteria bacterium]